MTPITLSGARRLVQFQVALFGGRDHTGKITYPVMCSAPDTARLYRRAFLTWEAEHDPNAIERQTQYQHSSDLPCPDCGDLYSDHPSDPMVPVLRILCGRRRVRL